jgi:hypothetical protein
MEIKMMIFDQKQQIVTKHNYGYGAEQFAWFWTKMAFLARKVIAEEVYIVNRAK